MTTSRFSHSWWLWAFRGLAVLVLGIGALSWPEPTLELLIRMIGVVVTAVGAVSFIASATNAYRVGARNALGLMGVLDICMGLGVFAWPGASALAPLWPVAVVIWALISGVLQLIAAAQFRQQSLSRWLLRASGFLAISSNALDACQSSL